MFQTKKSYLFGFESQFDEDLLQFLVDKVDAELYNAFRQSTHEILLNYLSNPLACSNPFFSNISKP